MASHMLEQPAYHMPKLIIHPLSPIPGRDAVLGHLQDELRVDGGLGLHPAEGLLVLRLLAGHGVRNGFLELLVGRHHQALLLGVAGLVVLDGLVVVLCFVVG